MIEKNKCTGCAACHDICPVNAIIMKPDAEGFLYPYIDEAHCISCCACERVCPVDKYNDSKINDAEAFAAKSRKKNTQMSSASGGIFPEIAKAVLDENGIVWGVAFDQNYQVYHTCIYSSDNLEMLCRSKYVQSNTIDVYKTIREQLRNGQKILFTGTPCQVSGLSRFVGEKLSANLYLVDIICHGVPSPKVWNEYIRELCVYNQETVNNISSIAFKYKDDVRKWNHPGFRVTWNSGREFVDFSNNTWYENGYLGNLFVRPSCHSCSFKDLRSPSDLTIGDFWGCSDVLPDIFDENGVSVVLSKTEKGNQLITKIKNRIEYMPISSDIAVKHNARIIKSAPPSRNRSKFWKSFEKMEKKTIDKMNRIVDRYTRKTFVERIINYMLRIKRTLRRNYGKNK